MDAAQYAGGVILALDVATRTGVAWGEPGEQPQLMTVNFGRPLAECYAPAQGLDGHHAGDVFGRAIVFTTRFMNIAAQADKPVRLIVIEGLVPQYDKTLQCGLWAIVNGIAAIKRIPVIIAPIQTWRAAVLGFGRLKKDEAKTRAVSVCTQLGWEPKGHDEAEAGCIWLWAVMQLAPRLAPRLPLFMRGAA